AGIGPGRTSKHGNWIIPIIVVLFDEGPEGIGPASARKVATKGVFIHVRGHGQLVQVVLAGGTISSLARLLHRRHQQTDKYGNNGNHHEQFNQRERFLSRSQKEQHANPPHKKKTMSPVYSKRMGEEGFAGARTQLEAVSRQSHIDPGTIAFPLTVFFLV